MITFLCACVNGKPRVPVVADKTCLGILCSRVIILKCHFLWLEQLLDRLVNYLAAVDQYARCRHCLGTWLWRGEAWKRCVASQGRTGTCVRTPEQLCINVNHRQMEAGPAHVVAVDCTHKVNWGWAVNLGVCPCALHLLARSSRCHMTYKDNVTSTEIKNLPRCCLN